MENRFFKLSIILIILFIFSINLLADWDHHWRRSHSNADDPDFDIFMITLVTIALTTILNSLIIAPISIIVLGKFWISSWIISTISALVYLFRFFQTGYSPACKDVTFHRTSELLLLILSIGLQLLILLIITLVIRAYRHLKKRAEQTTQ